MRTQSETRPWLKHGMWGDHTSTDDLPNVAGASEQSDELTIGDLASVDGAIYRCTDATLGEATWERMIGESDIPEVPSYAVGSAVINIPIPAKGGRFIIEPTTDFTDAQQQTETVLVQVMGGAIAGDNPDELELTTIVCAGEVRGPKQLLVRWSSPALVRGKFRFAYWIAG